jgi:hypothetical protein
LKKAFTQIGFIKDRMINYINLPRKNKYTTPQKKSLGPRNANKPRVRPFQYFTFVPKHGKQRKFLSLFL